MHIVYEPVVPEDAEDFAKTYYEAFSRTATNLYWSCTPSEESFKQMAEERRKSVIKNEDNPSVFYIKAMDIDADNRFVGVSTWYIFETERTIEELNATFTTPNRIPEVNVAFAEMFEKNLRWARTNIMGLEPVVLCGTVVIHPDYQRKGIGQKLMKFGTDKADELGLRSYLEASEEGVRLYESSGYKIVHRIIMDMKPFGGNGTVTSTVR